MDETGRSVFRRGVADGMFAAEGGRGHGRPPVEGGDERADHDARFLLRHGGRGGPGGRFDRVAVAGREHAGGRRAVEDPRHARRGERRDAGHSRRGAGRHVDSVPPHERRLFRGARFAVVRSPERYRPRRRAAARSSGREAGPAGASGRPLRPDGLFRRGVCPEEPRFGGRRDRQYDPRVAGIPPGQRRGARLCHGVDRRGAG